MDKIKISVMSCNGKISQHGMFVFSNESLMRNNDGFQIVSVK